MTKKSIFIVTFYFVFLIYSILPCLKESNKQVRERFEQRTTEQLGTLLLTYVLSSRTGLYPIFFNCVIERKKMIFLLQQNIYLFNCFLIFVPSCSNFVLASVTIVMKFYF